MVKAVPANKRKLRTWLQERSGLFKCHYPNEVLFELLELELMKQLKTQASRSHKDYRTDINHFSSSTVCLNKK